MADQTADELLALLRSQLVHPKGNAEFEHMFQQLDARCRAGESPSEWRLPHIEYAAGKVAEGMDEAQRRRITELEADLETLRRSRNLLWCSKGHEIMVSSPIPDHPILLMVKCPECGEQVRTHEAMKKGQDKRIARLRELAQHGHHSIGCKGLVGPNYRACDCGYNDARVACIKAGDIQDG